MKIFSNFSATTGSTSATVELGLTGKLTAMEGCLLSRSAIKSTMRSFCLRNDWQNSLNLFFLSEVNSLSATTLEDIKWVCKTIIIGEFQII